MIEDLETFRQRARSWIEGNLRRSTQEPMSLLTVRHDADELQAVAHERQLQRKLFDAGLAGICVPTEYGGQGLTPAHQQVLNAELAGREYPARLQAPTFTPCMSVLLDFGTEAQKLRHIPAILKGEEIWMQFLSEPSSGSDVAGALTSAVRDGEDWVLNGSKIWTTGGWWSDWGLCLARTNWDVPKHRGLTVFMLPITREGVQVHRIEMLSGNNEFCQEFFTDVRVPDSDRIGEIDAGWTVGTRWMFHERMLYNSPMVTLPHGTPRGGEKTSSMIAVARAAGRIDDPSARELVGEARMLELVGAAIRRRVGKGIMLGAMSDQSAAVGRLFVGAQSARRASITFELSGGSAGAWMDDDGATANSGIDFLMRQVASIGGGTTEMARNVVSERVLRMPRERALDQDVAFRDVPRGSART